MKYILAAFMVVLVILKVLATVEQAQGAIMPYESAAAFSLAVPDPEVVTFTPGTGDLTVVGSNPSFSPFVSMGKLNIPTDGNIFQATSFFAPDTFTAFGISLWGVGPGIFSLFVDGEFEWARPDARNDFFLGVTGEFDLISFSANVGPYMADNAKFTLIPEPSALLLVALGLICTFPFRK